ncbi:tripartite motif-containing protein 2-like, partial [Python bivittatus]|uniref:Tripartite motif-containing protein 2-like n=1 Tax=Python bivittatus TaxID=176946 RepID=A0A9F3W1E7_PYTBI
CLQNYIPAHSLTLSCPVCRQTSILPEKGVSALQNNFFITNLMDVLQRTPDSSIEESAILETVTAVASGKPLSCPNHEGNVSGLDSHKVYQLTVEKKLNSEIKSENVLL